MFREAVRRSGVRGAGRLSLHSLRHGYASLLIGSNVNPQFVSRQLGHANPSVTLEVYSHLFARREHGDLARQALEASYAAMRREAGPCGGGAVLGAKRRGLKTRTGGPEGPPVLRERQREPPVSYSLDDTDRLLNRCRRGNR